MTIIPAQQIEEFWNWFVSVADLLMAGTVEGELRKELDRRLRRLHRGLIWEIGPGTSRQRQFTISPNLNPNVRGVAQEIVFGAPSLENWEFYPARQAKEWNYKLLLDNRRTRTVAIDVSNWGFVLLRRAEGKHEVLLSAGNLPRLQKNRRYKVAADVLCNILGEELLLDGLTDFDVMHRFPPVLARRSTPIHSLREVMAGSRDWSRLLTGEQCVR
jgi:hypothetical protein